MNIQLEICANSLPSALSAQQGGADRIELCDNMKEGGTTPSPGTIVQVRRLLNIQLYPIIRPRGGDFLYTNEEYQIMEEDIRFCKKVGCDGVVIGLLTQEGEIDMKRTKQLVAAAHPLGVTFHRAYDRCRNPIQALEEIIDCGCERILTSGQEPTAIEGASLLELLVQKAGDRIAIMPGSGVLPENIASLIKKTKAQQYHSTAKSVIESKMRFENKLAEKEDNNLTVTDKQIVMDLRQKAEDVEID